jgi:hypothetical protein
MTELELQLRELGGSLAYPPTPDLARAVGVRLAERPRPWWRASSRRQAFAIALAVLAVSAAAVMAVPSARTAILRFLHIGAVTVERVETLPPARERPLTTGLGRRVSLDDGARSAGFRMLLPPLDDPVERVYVRDRVQSALLEVPGAGAVLLTEIPGSRQFDYAKKLSAPATRLDEVSVNGAFGIWIEGAPHVVMFEDRSGRTRQFTTRLAGNVLIWTRGDLTLRLEGELTKRRALELARSVREPAGS